MMICPEQMPEHTRLDANHRVACWLVEADTHGWVAQRSRMPGMGARPASPEAEGAMDKVLEIEQLTKVFSLGSLLSRVRITATDHVSFYVKPAEIFALAGKAAVGRRRPPG